MAAPTRQEIRLELVRAWELEHVAGKLEDALGFSLATAAVCELWDFPDEDDGYDGEPAVYRKIDSVLAPILADVRERALEAVAGVLESFAEAHPELSRKPPMRTAS